MQRACSCSLAFLINIFSGWLEWEWMAAEAEPLVSTHKGPLVGSTSRIGIWWLRGTSQLALEPRTKALLSPSTQYLPNLELQSSWSLGKVHFGRSSLNTGSSGLYKE
ncbi:hypothetical protein H1C71_001379 [Ictidomys tridecemlineatus]|nr:hypothetical protein H1C71_001379 [Ictidomys tridecemlineatus]